MPKPMPKPRSEINRQNYERNKAKRQEAARLRQQGLRDSWKQAIAEWDHLNEWTEPPADWAATGLSQSAIDSAMLDPSTIDWDDAA